MPDKLISTAECASRKGVTRQSISLAIKRGALKAERIGVVYVIREKDCAAYEPVRDDPAEMGRRSGAARRAASSKPAPGQKRGPGRPKKNAETTIEEGLSHDG